MWQGTSMVKQVVHQACTTWLDSMPWLCSFGGGYCSCNVTRQIARIYYRTCNKHAIQVLKWENLWRDYSYLWNLYMFCELFFLFFCFWLFFPYLFCNWSKRMIHQSITKAKLRNRSKWAKRASARAHLCNIRSEVYSFNGWTPDITYIFGYSELTIRIRGLCNEPCRRNMFSLWRDCLLESGLDS